MMVPAAAAWIGVPVSTAMSIPSWWVPHRGPNGEVIGPLTGQLREKLGVGEGEVGFGLLVVVVAGAWAGALAEGAFDVAVVGAGAADSSAATGALGAVGAGVARSLMIR